MGTLEYFHTQEKLPDKGVDIIGVDDGGDTYYCYRCNCHNMDCVEWRCSLTGANLMINVIKWIPE